MRSDNLSVLDHHLRRPVRAIAVESTAGGISVVDHVRPRGSAILLLDALRAMGAAGLFDSREFKGLDLPGIAGDSLNLVSRLFVDRPSRFRPVEVVYQCADPALPLVVVRGQEACRLVQLATGRGGPAVARRLTSRQEVTHGRC